MSYTENREWTDQYIPAIKSIVGPYLLQPSPFELDTQEATDLVVIMARNLRIACRVRRPGYLLDFDNQFTLRCELQSGVLTEEQKIINGWGDWMLYGHAHPNLKIKNLCRWFLIDLAAWRAHLISKESRKRIKFGTVTNGDKLSKFRWYSIPSFIGDPPLLIAEAGDYSAALGVEPESGG